VLSEGALMSVLTKNEIRKMAGFEPIQETTPTQMSACNHDEVFEKLKALGSDEYKILKYGFAVDSNEQAEYYENVLKTQKFSTIPELDLKVLQYLRENKLASENEIATALKQPLKDVVNSVKALQDGGFLKGNIGVEIEITTKGADELVEVPMLEVETRYTYAVRSNVAPANKSRDFCVQLMALSASGRTWSRQEIESITNEQGTSAWKYRGGWYHNPNIDANTPYCRHEWKQVIVTKK
jgi:DNA-binding Lrp family transcriptional regulator